MADDFESSCDYGSYVQKMRRPGTWGSQLELMAICQSFGVNAILHQSGLPAYEMFFSPPEPAFCTSFPSLRHGFPYEIHRKAAKWHGIWMTPRVGIGSEEQESRCIQLSYHDGEHYNSVRFSWDLEGPVRSMSLAPWVEIKLLKRSDFIDFCASSEVLRSFSGHFLHPLSCKELGAAEGQRREADGLGGAGALPHILGPRPWRRGEVQPALRAPVRRSGAEARGGPG